LYENVIKWWYLCALERTCIAPILNRACIFHGPHTYGKCHRFDQSAVNILLANYFADDHPAYMFYAALRGGAVLEVKRGSQHREEVSVCRSVVRVRPKDYFVERRTSERVSERVTRRTVKSTRAPRVFANVRVNRSMLNDLLAI